jgi:hypothetical protein
MDWSQEWINRYVELRNWIRPYLGGQIRLDEVDVFVIWAFRSLIIEHKFNDFIFLDKVNKYLFHLPSGYLLHLFMPFAFKFIRDKYGEKLISKIETPEPGRKIVYAERRIPGPRGGKLFALGSATHISVNPKIVSNPKSRYWLLYCKRIIPSKYNISYPNIYEAERRYWFRPFKQYFLRYAVLNLFPRR